MGGINFIHGGFLAGALAVAIPIAIHLLFRQKPKPISIGSLHFLKIVLQDHVRRRRVRRWLLLALRVAGVFLLVLLFARPYFQAAGLEGDEREVALLIDQSASMATQTAGRSAFQRAQEAAETYLEQLPSLTVAHLAYCDDSGVEPASDLTIDRKRTPGFGGTDYGKALAWARDLMVQSKRAERRVVFFSDLQRIGVDRTSLEGWPPGVGVEVIDVGKPVATNLAVTDAAVSRSEVRAGEPFIVSAVVSNTGAFPSREVVVRLKLQPRAIEREQKTTVDAGASQVVRFSLDALTPGLYQGSVHVDSSDSFPLDDRRWLAFDARGIDRVLLVDGDPGDSPFASQTYYLETALRLRPPGQASTATPYEPVPLAWTSGKRLPDLTNFRVVVLCDVEELADSDLSTLREFVTSGGRLVFFSGDQVTRALCERLRSSRLFPAEFLENTEPGSFPLVQWQKDHPLLRPFADPQHGDLRRLTFRRISRLKPDPGTVVLARDQEQNPWLLESTLGAGKILVFAVPASRDWGEWPVSRLFLPLVHQVLGYLTERLPETQRTRSLATGPGREHPPGVGLDGALIVTRNLDPRESDGERITPKEFRRALHLPADEPKSKAKPAVAKDPNAQRPDELWKTLVWALLAILVIETFIANRTHA